MKRYTFYIASTLVLVQIINQSCKNDSSFKSSPADTITQLMAYIDKDSVKTIWSGVRITKDSGYIFPGQPKVKWKRDTIYYVLGAFPVYDSLGRPRVDSAKKPIVTNLYYPLPQKSIIRDGDFRGFSVDSFLKSKK